LRSFCEALDLPPPCPSRTCPEGFILNRLTVKGSLVRGVNDKVIGFTVNGRGHPISARKSIAIVDDETNIVNSITHHLKKEGFRVKEYYDGASLLSCLNTILRESLEKRLDNKIEQGCYCPCSGNGENPGDDDILNYSPPYSRQTV